MSERETGARELVGAAVSASYLADIGYTGANGLSRGAPIEPGVECVECAGNTRSGHGPSCSRR